MEPRECCVLIPSLSPDEKLPVYVKELLSEDAVAVAANSFRRRVAAGDLAVFEITAR